MKKNYFKAKPDLMKSVLLASLLAGSTAFGQLYMYSSHTFTNAGAEGREGPTLAECEAAYVGEAFLGTYFAVGTQGIQEWTVPASGEYRITAAGAQGGNHLYTVDPEDGGLGAIMEGTFDLVEGQVIHILVGQQGDPSQEGSGFSEDNAAPGGGGGSFVWDPLAVDGEPMIAAGGGGAGASPGGYAQKDATITTDANPTQGLSNQGTGGNGGGLNNGSCSWWAGAGAGWLTNGTGGNQLSIHNYNPGSSGAEGGRTPANGGFGGIRWNDGSDEGGDGGFGGGGGGGSDNMNGGGGGGYSGGGGGRGCEISPGGGGSYNAGTDQTNSVGNTGMGYVTIELLCNPLVIDIPVTGVCIGSELTLTATSSTGGTVTWDGGVDNGVAFEPSLGTTTYSTTSSSSEDCAFSIEISASEVPTITAHSSTPAACEGATVTLWGEGGDTYVWSGSGAVTPVDSMAFPAESGSVTYTVVGSVLGCEADPVDIDLIGAPQPDVIGTATPAELCLGESYTLTGGGTGATTYNWGGGIADGATITQETAGTFVHTVIGVSDVGCGDTAFVSVVVKPTPIIDGGDDIAVCEGDEISLSATGAVTYTWSGGISDGTPFEAIAGTTTYTVTGTDDTGCSNTDEVVVTGVERPEVSSADVTDEFFGFDGSIDITVIGGSGEYTYAWSHGPTTEDVFGLGEGTYTVTIDDITVQKGLCPTEATYTISSFVGIDGNSAQALNAYPNPTTDLLTITFEGQFNYEVTTLLGELVLSGNAYDKKDLSMEKLADGTYVVKVFQGESINFIQVVKQ